MTSSQSSLRDLVATAVREAVSELVTSSVNDALGEAGHAVAAPSSSPGDPVMTDPLPATSGVHHANGAGGVESVRITSDAELDAFARHLLALFENPKNRQSLRAGRLRFRLAPGTPGSAVAASPRRIEHGAVTERQVKAAAEAGERVVLGPRAVITPLGREKARALGVSIEKER